MPLYPPPGGGTVDLSAPGPIGAGTPSTAAFTTLTASTLTTTGLIIGATVDAGGGGEFRFGTARGKINAGGLDGVWNFSKGLSSSSFTLSAPAATATPVLQLGSLDTLAPVAQTIRAQGSRSGTDTNVAAPDLKIQAGNSTGNAAPPAIVFQTPVPVASGTGAQTMTTGLTVKRGVIILPAYTVANLPAAADVPYGSCFVTDATAPTWGSTVAGGGAVKTRVWSDGASWIVG